MFAGTVVVMGVSGTGKTEVASLLATELGCAFIEADRLHSPGSVAKMASGVGLTDADRWPWLAAVAAAATAEPRQAVVACSALRRAYRDFLREQLGATRFVFLDGPPAVIRGRLEARQGHFFKAEMLDGQLSVLERPEADEDFVEADIRHSPERACAHRRARALRCIHGPEIGPPQMAFACSTSCLSARNQSRKPRTFFWRKWSRGQTIHCVTSRSGGG